MNNTQTLLGTLILGSILTFGFYGVFVNAQDSETYVKDDLYIEECGACHLAYAPALMPHQSWVGIMQGLEDHFGENAELDAEGSAHISKYLAQYALGTGGPSTMSQLARNLPQNPPLRVTEFPAFLDAHDVVKQQLEMQEWPDGFLSPCRDCHRQAADARFEKELLHPGYGPSFPSSPN